MPKILLIGCGRMGGALCQSWLKANYCITVLDPVKPALDVKHLTHLDHSLYDIIILAVKPDKVTESISSTHKNLAAAGFYLSIAAGKSLDTMQAAATGTPIIRGMPNTPCAIGHGITALIGNQQIKQHHKEQATQLMQAGGAVIWLKDEEQMHAVTALSGSGPAYVFHFLECLTKAGCALGLAEETALILAKQTVFGSSQLALKSEDSLETLRQNVTSPNGTTAAGLNVLMPELDKLMERTLKAAAQRSKEL